MNIHRNLFIIAIAINSCLAFLQNHPDETTEINRNRMVNKTITAAPGLTVDVDAFNTFRRREFMAARRS